MSKPDAWMPLYIGDYLRDTTRLTTEQHGAYLLLIMDYWTNGPLPDDDLALSQVTRLQASVWKKNRPAIARLFMISDGEWHHKRIDEEREKAARINDKQKANGAKGGRPKKTQTESQQKPMGFSGHNPNETPSQSQSPKTINPSTQPSSPDQLVDANQKLGSDDFRAIPDVPVQPGQWLIWFNQTQGTEYDPGSRFTRGNVWQTFTRWCGDGVSTADVSAGIARALAEAKGQISNLPGYVEKLLLNDQQARAYPAGRPINGRQAAIDNYAADAAAARGDSSERNFTNERDITGEACRVA